jgi:hypothetical protein
MPSLFVPRAVADRVLEDQGHEEAHRVSHIVKSLRAIDSRLGMFLCDRVDPENELRMGFWYVYRLGDNGMAAFWEVSAPDGSYVEPTESVVEAFRQMEHDSLEDLRDRRRAAERRRERREEERQALNGARLAEECDYRFRVQHAFPGLSWKD